MSPEAIQILDKTYLLIEKGWTQNWSARDAKGNTCSAISSEAVCWCLSGAVHCAAEGMPVSTTHEVLNKIRQVTGLRFIYSWNDIPGRTKQEVLELIDKARTA